MARDVWKEEIISVTVDVKVLYWTAAGKEAGVRAACKELHLDMSSSDGYTVKALGKTGRLA